MPALLDCRRSAAFILTLVHYIDGHSHKKPDNQTAAIIKNDLDRLIALGGIRPEKSPQETLVATTAMICRLYPQLRILSLGWLSHAPEDPTAMYFLAQADANLDDRGTALSLFQRAIARGLTGPSKTEALKQIKLLSPASATQPATTGPTTEPL